MRTEFQEEPYFSKRRRREKELLKLSRKNKYYAYAYYKLYQEPSSNSLRDWCKYMIQDFNL
jgi:hypothetical protein